jgi:ribosome biogenesis protein Tsr3
MKYLKLNNIGIEIFNTSKLDNHEGCQWVNYGFDADLIKAKVVHYTKDDGNRCTYLPIDKLEKVKGLLPKLKSIAKDLNEKATVTICEDDCAKWKKEETKCRACEEDKSLLIQARREAKIEKLKLRILDPNDELE